MSIVAIQAELDKLPVAELPSSLSEFLAPLTGVLPDKRLREVAQLGVQGIIAAQSPLISQIGRMVPRNEAPGGRPGPGSTVSSLSLTPWLLRIGDVCNHQNRIS